MSRLKEAGLREVLVVVGTTVPQSDIPALTDLGVAHVFPTGASLEEIAGFIRERVKRA